MSQIEAARPRRVWPAALCAALALGALPAYGQSVQVQVGRGPHYVGEGVEISVIAEGFERDPQPEIRAPSPDRGTLSYHGVSPQVASSITIVNGQITRQRRVTFTYHFRYRSQHAGRASLPPFQLVQDAVRRETEPIALQLRDIPPSDEIGVRVSLPAGPIFVGQKVLVSVEFRIARELQRDLVSYNLRVPLFESHRYRFVDDPGNRDTELQIQTAEGTLLLAAKSRELERAGKKYLVVTAQRTMIPLEPGIVETAAPSVIVNQGTRFRRDLFRSRQPTAVRKFVARGKAVSLEVAELPKQGRPPSFAGAIGRGYSLDVSADRSVVQVGEPIALSFHLRGDGDLSTAALPRLDAEGLLDRTQFRVPSEPPPGRIADDGKHFDVTVRVLDSAVREIPALEYSWFDADSRRFETTRSRPIALSVGAAEVIGAADVERRESPEQASTNAAADPLLPSGGPIRSGSLALTGADLAVERDREILLRDQRVGGGGSLTLAGLYAFGIACVGVAALDRRHRDIDPRLLARRRSLAAARREAEAALEKPERDGAEALARALRTMLSQVPDTGSPELDALLGECDARSYALTATSPAPLPDELRERASRLARALEEAGQ